jgi:hypothetical protein
VHRECFAAIPGVLENFAFETATESFVDFLFIFVVMAGRANGSVRQTGVIWRHGKPQAQVIFSRWPLPYFDFLVRTLDVSKEDVGRHAALRILSVLLLVKNLDCRNVVDSVVDWFEKSPNRIRILALIIAFIRYSEDTIDLSDFGLQRHAPSLRARGSDMITVDVYYEGIWSQVTISRFAKTEDLQKKIGFKRGWDPATFTLKFYGEYLHSGVSLASAKITSRSQIYVCASPRPNPAEPPALPTAALFECGFSSVLLTELVNSTDPHYVKELRQLLKLLPTDVNVIDSLRNIPRYMESLREPLSDPLIAYKLQVLVS